MIMERMTAVKVNISELVNGEWVQKDGMEPSFVRTPSGVDVSRARILGTVIAKFLAEDGNFASLTIDDSSETIRAKTFKTLKPVDRFNIGDLVDLIGKVREYNGEIYIMPEVIRKVEPNTELLRKLEILAAKKGVAIKEPELKKVAEVEKPVIGGEIIKTGGTEETKEKEMDRDALRKEIIKIIEAEKNGIKYENIVKKVKAPEEIVESVINEILSEGICYEPSPGRIRKI